MEIMDLMMMMGARVYAQLRMVGHAHHCGQIVQRYMTLLYVQLYVVMDLSSQLKVVMMVISLMTMDVKLTVLQPYQASIVQEVIKILLTHVLRFVETMF